MITRAFRAAVLALLTCSTFAYVGCAPVNLRGNGFGDNTATWGRKLRPTTEPGNMLGLDTRAQQIEQNLGVR